MVAHAWEVERLHLEAKNSTSLLHNASRQRMQRLSIKSNGSSSDLFSVVASLRTGNKVISMLTLVSGCVSPGFYVAHEIMLPIR